MKKLLFAAMAAAMASVASAATENWTFGSGSYSLYAGYTGAGQSSANLGSGYKVYYISVHQGNYAWDTDTGRNKLNDVAGKVLAALRSGDSVASGAGAANESVFVASKTVAGGSVEAKSDVGVDSSLYAYPSSSSTATYLEVLTAVVGNDYVYLAMNRGKSADKSYILDIHSSKYLRDSTGEGNFSEFGWYAIPEPTSGLLLLIGMAGLALKRKRA